MYVLPVLCGVYVLPDDDMSGLCEGILPVTSPILAATGLMPPVSVDDVSPPPKPPPLNGSTPDEESGWLETGSIAAPPNGSELAVEVLPNASVGTPPNGSVLPDEPEV